MVVGPYSTFVVQNSLKVLCNTMITDFIKNKLIVRNNISLFCLTINYYRSVIAPVNVEQRSKLDKCGSCGALFRLIGGTCARAFKLPDVTRHTAS